MNVSLERLEMMRVYIYGSCVTRDAFNLSGAPDLVNYRARSTMGSAFGPKIDKSQLRGFDIEKNPSPFQRRMVKADIEKSLPSDLRQAEFDALILDFIDERFSVARVGAGLVTRSADAVKCGLRCDPSALVHFGSDEHLELFRAGWKSLLNTVDAEKIIVNRVYWAKDDSDGIPVEDSAMVDRSNMSLDRLYAVVEADPRIRIIDYPAGSFVAASKHKWGRSPFHYVPEMYEATLKRLSSIVSA